MSSKKIRCVGKAKLVFQVSAIWLLVGLVGCTEYSNIREIHLSSPDNNALKVQIEIDCTDSVGAYIKYWMVDSPSETYTTDISGRKTEHVIVLTNLQPETGYGYQVVTVNGKQETESKVYDFKTNALPFWLKDRFHVFYIEEKNIPPLFKNGYVMLYQRQEPGLLYFINYRGDIAWYHRVENTGFKVAHFTDKKTILCILGSEAYDTNYGDQIMELSLTGDTMLNLRKGEGDFQQTAHHEVLKTPDDHIAMLTLEERVMDLSSLGGNKNDTIKGDGILVLNREGKQVWHWSVFDILEPLKEKNILREKSDWLHANSLTYAPDGNFLISFYNNGQIWKINSTTGELMWKLGKGGDFKFSGPYPDRCHSVHYVSDNTIMLFDNGTKERESFVYKISIQEDTRTASTQLALKLPKDLFNERMGSAYLVGDTSLLICASKRNSIVLSKSDGTYLWLMNTGGISPYRAEFISGAQVTPFLQGSRQSDSHDVR